MGYAPGLAWVRYNQVDFHLGGMIIKSPSASTTPDDSTIQHRSYHEIHACNCRDVNNQRHPQL